MSGETVSFRRVRTAAFAVAATTLLVATGIAVLVYRDYQSRLLVLLEAPPVAYPAGDREPGTSDVLLLGDSRIALWHDWERLGSAVGLSVANRGASGETTSYALARVESLLNAYRPSVVIVQTGINDLKTLGVIRDSSQRTRVVQSCTENIRSTVERCVELGASVVLTEVLYPASPGLLRRIVWSPSIASAVTECNRVLREAYQERDEVVVVDLNQHLSTGERLGDRYATDTLHLNQDAYGIITTMVAGAIVQVTRRSQ